MTMGTANIIEISSSPEPQSVFRKRRKRAPTRPAKVSPFPLVELSDSDTDQRAGPSQAKKVESAIENKTAEAGPSNGASSKSLSLRVSKSDLTPLVSGSSKPHTQDQDPNLATDGEETDFFSSSSEHVSSVDASPVCHHPENGTQFPIEWADEQDVQPADSDLIDGYVAQVLEIIPDVEPEHLLELVKRCLSTAKDNVLQTVLHLLFDDPTYPKLSRKGKRKRDEEDNQGGSQHEIDYADKHRDFDGGADYIDLALEQLFLDFPYIPKPHLRNVFFTQNALYAPTYIFVAKEEKSGVLSYTPKTIPSRAGKGKSMARHSPHFEAERQWLVLHFQNEIAPNGTEPKEEYENNDDGIECGCCFSTYAFDQMIQCPETHLFCKSCMRSYASGLLGQHNPNILCMDQSGCKLAFPISELRRFLTPKLMELYDRVKQTKEVEAAGLENLEHCPFCEYKVVIENPDEKLFRCENKECAAVSCRGCKKLDHLPKGCKELEDDAVLDGRHTIEEAMSRALVRNCPKCDKAFIKEEGCNKMACPNCFTLSCYVCRKVINGYDHFSTTPGTILQGKCVLWVPVEKHNDEVTAAAKRAIKEYKREHPNVDEKDIRVDLPRPTRKK